MNEDQVRSLEAFATRARSMAHAAGLFQGGGAGDPAAWAIEIIKLAQGADEALDALEGMVEQYFTHMPDGTLRHSFMSCEEHSVHVLSSLRPERWVPVGRSGIRFNGRVT